MVSSAAVLLFLLIKGGPSSGPGRTNFTTVQ